MRWSLLLLLLPGSALAWPPNGVRLTGAANSQVVPQIVSDGTGGAFVAWIDRRDYFNGNPTGLHDCYLQRVTASGQIAPGWPVDGLPIATGPGHQVPMSLVPDGVGGVLVLRSDTRLDFGDFYLHRITAAGTVAAGWPATGVPVAVAPGTQGAPEMVTDGAGGVFVAWQDGREATDSQARITRVLGNGEIAPGWPVDGRLFEPTAVLVSRPLMLASESGGFLACWAVSDDTLASVGVLAQRFTSEGEADPAWPVGGVEVCPALPASRGPVDRLVPDGTGGFYTIMEDYRTSLPGTYGEIDLYAQHALGSGTIAPGWPADALAISALPGVVEQYPSICEDGRGGAFVAWEDYRTGSPRLFGQHLRADGQPHAGWPALGLNFVAAPGFQLSPKLAWDGWDGVYVTWHSLQAEGYRSYVQHLTATGTPATGWPASGLPVVPIPTDQYLPSITADGLGGAIIAWEDIRESGQDVYAQRFVNDGVVATQVSLASVEALTDEVRLRWRVSGETRASVERRESDGAWALRAELMADGGGYMSLVDRDVAPGSRYDYRLVFASGARGGEASVVVPALTLALEGARPNPAVGALTLALTLPDASAARLELFDLAGRQVAAREVGAHGPGRHVVRLDNAAIAPGLYWATITQGGRTLRARVAVVR